MHSILEVIAMTSLTLLSSIDAQRTESSAEYLQKTMIELQELNVPSLGIQEAFQLSKPAVLKKPSKHGHLGTQNPQVAIYPTDKIDLDVAAAENLPEYQQMNSQVVPYSKVHVPKSPEPLGFTRAELAMLYKNALEKGSVVSLAALTNSLESEKPGQVAGMELATRKQPMYHYYFFPLKTFASELKKDKVTPSPDSSGEPAETSQKEMSNPLFVAISTFVSMALLFMVGVLFLPKITQYVGINARGVQDELLDLTSVVMDAIDRQESNETDHTRFRCNKGRRKR